MYTHFGHFGCAGERAAARRALNASLPQSDARRAQAVSRRRRQKTTRKRRQTGVKTLDMSCAAAACANESAAK